MPHQTKKSPDMAEPIPIQSQNKKRTGEEDQLFVGEDRSAYAAPNRRRDNHNQEEQQDDKSRLGTATNHLPARLLLGCAITSFHIIPRIW